MNEQRNDNGVPRRARIDLNTPAELAIREAMLAVEALPPDMRLTAAVVLLEQARSKVADYVDAMQRLNIPYSPDADLREACKEVLCESNQWRPWPKVIVDMVQAAIAKAEGADNGG